MIPKAYAYILREHNGTRQLLVFAHRDFPDAGIQVPGGTIDEGETPEAAVVREIEEESGLRGLHIERQLLINYHYSQEYQEWQRRHFILLSAPEGLPDAWQHTVSSGERDKDMVFCYEWWALERANGGLAGGKGAGLPALLP